MPAFKTSLLVLVLALVAKVDNSRILGVFPHPGLSHYKFFKPIMSGLADAGHEVVVVSYFPDTKTTQKNYVDIALTNTEEILTEIVGLEV
jgi:glucuronosyltransferase